MDRAPIRARQSIAQIATAAAISHGLREKTRKKWRSFTSAEKLETQNGIMKNRTAGQKPMRNRIDPESAALMHSAKPMINASPKLVPQSRGLGSKYRTSTTRYQMK